MKDLQQLKQTIQSRLVPGIRIGIMSHVEPDGDGFCASIALQHILRSRSMESEIIVDEGQLERFEELMDGVTLRKFESGLGYDLLFVLDCNSYIRIGEREELVHSAGYTILIDHHVAENGIIEADFSFGDTSSVSVGAIIFRTFQEEIETLPVVQRIPIGNCIYTTIMNDSNNFTNANTDKEVFQISAELCALGIAPYKLYRSYFLNHEPLAMRYIGEVLSTIEMHHNHRILFMLSTLDMQQRNNLTADAIMNITRWVQGVKGVDVIFYLREEAANVYKLSLRSPSINVNAVAAMYGGGGHRSASGAELHGEFGELKNEILTKLSQALDEYAAETGHTGVYTNRQTSRYQLV